MTITGDIAHLTKEDDGLLALNISDPTNITKIGEYDNSIVDMVGIENSGNYLFVSMEFLGLNPMNVGKLVPWMMMILRQKNVPSFIFILV